MGYNVSFVGGDIFVGGSKVECFVKEILANGRIEFFDIKANDLYDFVMKKKQNPKLREPSARKTKISLLDLASMTEYTLQPTRKHS